MRKLVAAAVLAASALALSACGTTSGGTDDAAMDKGTVGILLSAASSEAQPKWADTATKALEEIGWTTEIIDGAGDPAKFQQAITGFINKTVDGILTVGVDAGPVTSALQQAQAADIPVIAVGVGVDPSGEDLFAASFSPSDAELGEMTADYMKDKFELGDEYVVLDLTAAYGAHAPVVAAEPLLEEAGFTLAGTTDMRVDDLINSAQKGAVDLMTANPDAKFVFGCCDFTAPLTVPALSAAGFPDVLQTVRLDNESTLDLIRSGSPVVTAASDNDQGVLIAVDQILAHKATGDAVDKDADEGVYHYEIIDASNVPPAGEFVFDIPAMIDEHVEQWKSEYLQ